MQDLNVEQDARVQSLGAPEYDVPGQRYLVRPEMAVRNPDGTIMLKYLLFVYAESAGRLSGTLGCGGEITP
ncbi:hypothetical protein HNQ08_004630 [Deinococcus humi]|uniref:Uncharacterized protein n=1 Tax=Deinococcus humi TaxID=662880 RepID=A0A7W8JYI0_9DEIO|nr:hypothetical protein [Deinococcus humi]GGO37587.1 hypothetical protein GCM10008949_42940 [Deinococcus humi]